jgi:predicted HTH domain antitoxin
MSPSDAAAFARQMVAFGYYTQNNVSIGHCAKIAGMSEEDFILFLGRHGVDIFDCMTEGKLLGDITSA